ncbi:MAG: cation transporter [Lactobacillus sp.]|jgi:copper chaperone CopZ|nr:cation transporter [Lactobacillus sp.]
MAKKIVHLEGMKCNGCAENVQKAFSALDGVEKVSVNLKKQEAKVTGEVDDANFTTALAGTHYSVVNVETK